MAGRRVLVITGPTATGKTLLGVRLAEMLGGEIVSADSMQVYRRMDIGTAKPSAEEMGDVPHHMIDVAEPQDDYSVARYVREAVPCVDDILKRGRLPIVVGGSNLYVDSLIRGRVFASRGDPKLRQALEARYDKLGGKALLAELQELDAITASNLHENDKKRIVRALEVVQSTGIPLSRYDYDERALPARFDAVKIALNFTDRAVLYGRIRNRVDAMMSAGFVKEVSELLESGVSRACTSMQAIGYKEIAEAVGGGEMDLAAVAEKIKMESTRYAKRQLTWLRRDAVVKWIEWDTVPDIERGARQAREFVDEAE